MRVYSTAIPGPLYGGTYILVKRAMRGPLPRTASKYSPLPLRQTEPQHGHSASRRLLRPHHGTSQMERPASVARRCAEPCEPAAKFGSNITTSAHLQHGTAAGACTDDSDAPPVPVDSMPPPTAESGAPQPPRRPHGPMQMPSGLPAVCAPNKDGYTTEHDCASGATAVHI